MPKAFLAPLLKYIGRLRFPQMFCLTAVVFLVDLCIPDFIPFADEFLLGLGTLLLGSWRKRKAEQSSVEESCKVEKS